jgi:FAD-dependent urate hydroxylase
VIECEVAVIGAGPYGLSVAAHLRRRGVDFRIFGAPMQNWRAMPKGMLLKSPGIGSSLSDPMSTLTLERYCASKGIPYSDHDGEHGVPVSLQTFVEYGLSFQSHLVPELCECTVERLAGKPGKFELYLDGGGRVTARSVVVAVGISYFDYTPPALSGLPRELVTHSREHSDLSRFAHREVIVIGAGQSALEISALLNEHGANVQLLVRGPHIKWHPAPTPGPPPRFAPPQTELGSGWKNWLYCNGVGVFHHLPQSVRRRIVQRALGPAGSWWLRERVEGRLPIRYGRSVRSAREQRGKICLSMAGPDGRSNEVYADHVIAATGYKADVTKLKFLDPDLLARLRRDGSAPKLSPNFESSVPGLYFTGLISATQFGPPMRFVFGAAYTARQIMQSLRPANAHSLQRTQKVTSAGSATAVKAEEI